MENQPEVPAAVSLTLDESGKQLLARIPAGADVVAVNKVELQKLIADQGYAAWRVNDAGLSEVCALLGKLESEKALPVAECLDGEFAITESQDAMEAWLSITPPRGGEPVAEMQIKAALSEKGITQGVEIPSLSEMGDKAVIARGTPAVDGEDTRFESLMPAVVDKRPRINEDGSVDYTEIGGFITVEPGDDLMRRVPPTDGTNGVDIYGKVVTARPGKDLAFASRLNGVEIDAGDPNLLKAAIGGQPEVVDQGMQVNPVISVENVDLNTGNIDFNGTVTIRGNVKEGMKIYATGDVLISGMAEGAHIEAGGDIVISNGVIGRGDLKAQQDEPGHGIAVLKSAGSIEARFIENAIVEAGKNVTVGDAITHSEVTAHNAIIVGKKASKKGHIRGGLTRATMFVEAQILGSPANVKTVVEVGVDPGLNQQLREARDKAADKSAEYAKLKTLISRLKGNTDDKSQALLVRALATLEQLHHDLPVLNEALANIESRIELTDTARVTVGTHAYPGTTIIIGRQRLDVNTRTEKGQFIVKDRRVTFELA